jgi:hypothetical protein
MSSKFVKTVDLAGTIGTNARPFKRRCDSHKAFQKKSGIEIDSVQFVEIKLPMVLVPRKRWTG